MTAEDKARRLATMLVVVGFTGAFLWALGALWWWALWGMDPDVGFAHFLTVVAWAVVGVVGAAYLADRSPS